MHCYIRNLGSSIFAVTAAVAFSQKRAIALNNTMPFAATSNSVPFLIIFSFVLFSFQQSQHALSVSLVEWGNNKLIIIEVEKKAFLLCMMIVIA